MNGVLKVAKVPSPEELRRIEQGFSEKLGCEITLEVLVDESLIGGFLATIDGVAYDMSYRAQLEDIGKHLR